MKVYTRGGRMYTETGEEIENIEIFETSTYYPTTQIHEMGGASHTIMTGPVETSIRATVYAPPEEEAKRIHVSDPEEAARKAQDIINDFVKDKDV